MNHDELIKILLDKGYETGWVITDGVLTLWEHDAEPPAPLTRPNEAAPTIG
jgi:hypothetical protein